jgi:hypothetical protein
MTGEFKRNKSPRSVVISGGPDSYRVQRSRGIYLKWVSFILQRMTVFMFFTIKELRTLRFYRLVLNYLNFLMVKISLFLRFRFDKIR